MLRKSRCWIWLFSFVALPCSAGNGVWTSNGPEGGLLYDVATHPTDSARLIAAARAGIFRSDDGGFSWTQVAGSPRVFIFPNSSIAIDAEQPDDVYALTPGRGLYRSTDGGQNWSKTAWATSVDWNLGRVHDAPGEIGALFVNIRQFTTGATAVSPLLRSSSFGDSFAPFGSGLPDGRGAQSLALPPGPAGVMLLGVFNYSIGSGNPNPPSLYRSVDAGANWTGIYVEPTTSANIGSAAHVSGLTFADASHAYAQISNRVRRSDDGGLNWIAAQTTPVTMAVPLGASHSLLFATTSAPMTVWAHGTTGLRKSTDGGVTFADVTGGLSPNSTYLPQVPPSIPVQPSILRMAATPDYVQGVSGSLWMATEGGGLYRSLDFGTNWVTSHDGLEAVNIRALAVHPGQHVSNRPNPGAPAQRIHAGFADLVSGSTGMYASTNAGANWNVLNNGLKGSQIRSIVIDAATTGGVEPNGQPSNPPAVTPPSPSSTRMYAAGMSTLFPSPYRNGGIYRSTNGGVSWSVIDAGLPTRTFTNVGEPPTTINVADVGLVRQLALDPRSCSPAVFPCVTPLRRLWAAANGFVGSTTISPGIDPHCTASITSNPISHRVLRSVDGGDNWAAADNGLPPSNRQFCSVSGVGHTVGTMVNPITLLVAPNDSNVLYLGTVASIADLPAGHVIPDMENGVFKSIDGGNNWTHVSNGLPSRAGFSLMKRDVLSLAIHPDNDQILWCSVIETLTPGTSAVYKTIDGGANWLLSSEGLPSTFDIRSLIVDPGDANILYAAGAGTESDPGAVYRSDDGGATWRSISVALPADSGSSLALDPFNSNTLYAGMTSGVWSLTQVPDDDGDGVPDATENNAPNGGDGNGDTTSDSEQASVGSTVVILRRDAKGSGGFFTTDVLVASSTPAAPGGCQQAVDVQAVLAAQYGRDYVNGGPYFYKYPRDLVRFEVLDCARAIVDATFHNAAFATEYGWRFRYFGPATPGDDDSFGWSDISARVQRVTGSSTKWRLTLDANQFGSYRPVNDRVLFIGGPACYDDRIFRNSLETVADTGPPTCDH